MHDAAPFTDPHRDTAPDAFSVRRAWVKADQLFRAAISIN